MAKTVNSDICFLYKGSITFHLTKRISTLCSGYYMQVIKSLQHHFGAIALRVRALVKLSAVFFHGESSITIGRGGHKSAIAPII